MGRMPFAISRRGQPFRVLIAWISGTAAGDTTDPFSLQGAANTTVDLLTDPLGNARSGWAAATGNSGDTDDRAARSWP